MTNTTFQGKKGPVVNPYAKRAAVSNPYAKKSNATVTPKPKANNAAVTNKQQSYYGSNPNRAEGVSAKTQRTVANTAVRKPQGNAAVSKSLSNNPYAHKSKAVTPTPKKKQILHKHNKPSSMKPQPTAKHGYASSTRVSTSSHVTPKAAQSTNVVNRPMPNAPMRKMATSSALPNQNKHTNTTTTSRPQSLKQSLKSQIAQIKRRKQLLIQQKEAEKLRKQRQIELQKLQRQREREARRLLRQQQRQAVEGTLNHIITRVKQRMELEHQSGGVHYSIGEAMSNIINSIEQRDREEKRLIREKKARLRKIARERKVQVRQCLMDIVSGVERRVYGVDHMRQQQQQLQQQQMMVMKARQLQQMQQQQSHQRMMPTPMYYAQQGVAMPNYGMYYPQMPAGYPMQQQMPMQMQQQIPMQVPAYYHPNNMLPRPQNTYGLPPTQTIMNPATNMVPSKLATKKPAVLSANVLLNPHSPYVASHQLITHQLCLIKKEAKDSFGVTLRHESRSVLVAREELSTSPVAASTTSGSVATTIAPAQVSEKKPRRKRVAFDVLTVVEASKARVVLMPNNQPYPLQPGDIFVTINGRDVGGMTFGEACRFISTSSSKCPNTGEIRCVLTVARRKVPLHMTGASNNLRLPQFNPSMQASRPTVPLIPFNVFGERVIGDFSSVEWCAIIQAFPIVTRSLTTGMALMPVAKMDVCANIKERDAYKVYLTQRSIESIQAKIAFEGKRIDAEARQKAEEYWRTEWEKEVKSDADNENNSLVGNFLTDAQRSALRSKARPSSGCKCGSKTHNFVSDAQCVLFRDVKHFCARNSVKVDDNEKKLKGKKISTKGKGKLEAAYIRRFNQLREENAATKEEAEFVLKMEQQQSYGMKKAVFAPNSLCTMVLSAVAAVADLFPEDRQQLDLKEVEEDGKRMDDKPKKAVDKPMESDDSDDSDDEDLPLHALLKHPTSSKRAGSNSKLPSPKRAKQAESSNDGPKQKAVPSAYILAEILLHISKTFGHLFSEPTHSNYAWQQRHRSVITTPLSKDVMFAGNPRKPGTLSFENVRFVISEDRLARLRKSWLNRDQLKLSPQPANEELRQWNDQWTITHLSSDTVTGLVHEIGVLENLGILKVLQSGSVVLVQGWETKIPHMILNEMKDDWGSNMDVNNLHCIHEKITSSLDNAWQHDGDGWRLELGDLNDDDDMVYEDEEYELRRQIFLENYDAFVNSRKGVGEFGI